LQDEQIWESGQFPAHCWKTQANLEKEGGPIRNVGNSDPTAVIRFWKLTSLIDCRNDVGYIMGFSNVSSQGEQCMMTLMVDLIILVMFTSDSASDVERTGTGGTNSGGNEGR